MVPICGVRVLEVDLAIGSGAKAEGIELEAMEEI